MADLSTKTVPLLPLNTGVVLPGMVVTVTVETPEAAAAADAAGRDGELVLVPRVDGSWSRIGVLAKVENAGQLPNGARAMIVRGLHRARIDHGVLSPAGATDK